MDQDLKSFERSCIAMGLHYTPEQLQEKYAEYTSNLAALKRDHPEEWAAAEEQERRQRESDRAFYQSMRQPWEK